MSVDPFGTGLRSPKHGRLDQWIYLTLICMACGVVPMFTDGVRAPVLAATPILILLAGWLLGSRAMLGATAFFSLVVLGYAAAENAGWWLPPAALRAPADFASTLVLLQGMTALAVLAVLDGFGSTAQREIALQADLAESELLFRALLTSLHDGILVVNYEGKVEYANQQLCAMYSIDSPPESFIGHDSGAVMIKISQMYPDPDSTVSRLREIIRAGIPRLGTELVLKNGRTLMRDFIPFEYGDGRRGRIWHMRDITALRNTQTQLIEANRKLEGLSFTDGLTGLGNRRHFDQVLLEEWSRAQRQGHSLALLLMDVDWFKRFNDRYGHPAGDACLQAIAATLQAKARRAGDLAARYGGEEFALIAPETGAETAMALADSIRLAIHGIEHAHEDSPIGRVTVSIGVAIIVPGRLDEPDRFLQDADQALYRAKSLGRNRVIAARG